MLTTAGPKQQQKTQQQRDATTQEKPTTQKRQDQQLSKTEGSYQFSIFETVPNDAVVIIKSLEKMIHEKKPDAKITCGFVHLSWVSISNFFH